MNTPKILVTGASGFIGRQVLQPLIAQGSEVHAIANKKLPVSETINWYKGDLLNPSHRLELISKIKPEILLHIAWYAEHGKFWHAPENKDWLIASKDLFQRFAYYGGRRIIGVGSCAEYNWQRTDNKYWQETDVCLPATLYGQSKHQTHDYLKSLGIDYCWARLFLSFGEYEPKAKLIPSVINSLLNKKPALCSSGKQHRDFTDVKDIGQCLALLASSSYNGAINLASGQSCTIAQLTQQLAQLLNAPELLHLGALVDRAGDPEFMLPDTTLLNSAINYSFPPLIQRLQETIMWWRQYNN